MSPATSESDPRDLALVRELRAILASPPPPSDARAARLGAELRALMDRWALEPSSAPASAVDSIVDAVCELALDTDEGRSSLGRGLIFSSIAEHLADSFEPDKATLYNRLFARVIHCCRRHPAGGALDRRLSQLGVPDVESALERRTRAALGRTFPAGERRGIRRVLVPSRVTLGADVAVTSIVLQGVERVFPQAECVVLGPIAVAELLGRTVRNIRFVDVPYRRRGGLMSRFDSWVRMADVVRTETAPEQPGSCLILDPDSRITQLGLLPLASADVPAFLFESRAFGRAGPESLSELTGCWLTEVLGPGIGDGLYPKVALDESLAMAARSVTERARAYGGGHVTTVTLGVGGNPGKRGTERFELDLLRGLLAEGGIVILDKGVEDEIASAEAIVAELAAEGVGVVELQTAPLGIPPGSEGRLLVYQGGVGPLAALVAGSDLYVGYDSAFQHVAAALEIPSIDIFVNPPNRLFSTRWRPYSKASVQVVELVHRGTDADDREALVRVLAARRAHRTTVVDRR
jgi:hypothetical protein